MLLNRFNQPVSFTADHVPEPLRRFGVADAWQVFSADALRTHWPGLVDHGARGKDGCIDLSAVADGSTVVGECKHVESGSLDDALDAWVAVEEKLTTHLADSAGPTKGQSQYRPWYDAACPIRHYVFCTNAVPVNEREARDFVDRIRTFFRDTLGARPHLVHLRDAEVELWHWGRFEAALRAHPDLRFRWFPSTLPRRLHGLARRAGDGTFTAFLEEDRLPCYRLSTHATANPLPEGTAPFDEAAILEELDGTRHTGVVISGAGGVGKTRLMLEVGRLAETQGWLVLRADPDLEPDAVDELVAAVPKTRKILLLLDYVEMQMAFGTVARRLIEYRRNEGYGIRYVANCRAAYYHYQIVPQSEHWHIDLSSPNLSVWLRSYRHQLVEHVLAFGDITVSSDMLERLRDAPVLAVFLFHLKQRMPGIPTSGLLERLAHEEDFDIWVRRRLECTFGRSLTRQERHELVEFAAMLPVPAQLVTSRPDFPLANNYTDLLVDGWIERNIEGDGDRLRAIHDVVPDQIISSYLKGLAADIQGLVARMIRCGRKFSQHGNIIRSLARIGNIFPALRWVEVVDRDLMNESQADFDFFKEIIRYPVFGILDKLEILERFSDTVNGLEKDIDVQNVIEICISMVIRGDVSIDDTLAKILKKWTFALASSADCPMEILKNGIRMYKNELKKYSLSWISSNSRKYQSHEIIKLHLTMYEYSDEIEGHVIEWIAMFINADAAISVKNAWITALGGIKSPKSSIVLTTFIEAQEGGKGDGEGVKFVQHDTVEWLDANWLCREAADVYIAYYNATGDIFPFEDKMRQWVEENSQCGATDKIAIISLALADCARSVETTQLQNEFQVEERGSACFEIIGNIAVAGPREAWLDVRQWLDDYAVTAEAQFLLKAWLDAGGSAYAVASDVRRWLDWHVTAAEASHVLKAWLDAGGGAAPVSADVRRWLDAHGQAVEASHVLKAWLDAGGGAAPVSADVRRWLDAHGQAVEASHVLKAWLDAGGGVALVSADVRRWLNVHGLAAEALFVLKAWLDAGGGVVPVSVDVHRWLDAHGLAAEAPFVLTAWLDAGRGVVPLSAAVRRWLDAHGLAAEASHVLKAWLDAGGGVASVSADVRCWLDEHGLTAEARFVLTAWLDAGGGVASVSADVRRWLDEHGLTAEARFVLTAWLDAGGGVAPVSEAVRRWLADHHDAWEVNYVCVAWLRQGGDPATVRAAALAWHARHHRHAEATYLGKFLARLPDLPVETAREILVWCRTHPSDENAIWRLSQLLERMNEPELLVDVSRAVDEVLATRLADPSGMDPVLCRTLPIMLSHLLAHSANITRLRGPVDRAFLAALRRDDLFAGDAASLTFTRPDYLMRLYDLLRSGALDLDRDRELLQRFALWLDGWNASSKRCLDVTLHRLRRDFPAPDLWDLVRLP